MSGINPISSIVSQPIGPSPLAGPATTADKPAVGQSGFGDMLKTAMEKVEGDQQASTAAMQDLMTGGAQDPLGVVSAVAKADMSFKLLIGVRNKVIEAYKQTMNMQI